MKTTPRSSLLATLTIVVGAVISSCTFLWKELCPGGEVGFPLDDSWIHLVFARNMLRGGFFEYNLHQPVAGSTSPLWTIILAAGLFISNHPIVVSKTLGMIFHVVIGLLSWKLAEQMGMSRVIAVMTALLVVFVPRLIWASVSGMEVSLYVMLSLASIYTYLWYANSATWRWSIPWILCGIAVWARPELALQPAFFVVHQFLVRRQINRNAIGGSSSDHNIIAWTRIVAGCFLFVLCLIPYIALNEWTSGMMLPLTFYAKSTADLHNPLRYVIDLFVSVVRRPWQLSRWFWFQDNLFLSVIVIGATVIGIWKWLRNSTAVAPPAIILFVVSTMLFAPVRTLMTGSILLGQSGRYAAQTAPLIILLGVWFVGQWIKHRRTQGTPEWKLLALLTIVGVMMLIVYYVSESFLLHGRTAETGTAQRAGEATQYIPSMIGLALWGCVVIFVHRFSSTRLRTTLGLHGFVLILFFGFAGAELGRRGNEYEGNISYFNDTHGAIGRWINDHTPPGSVYATCDIGVMAFNTPHNMVIDVKGLIEPEIAARIRGGWNNEQVLLDALHRYRPLYLACYVEAYSEVTRKGMQTGALTLIDSVPLHRRWPWMFGVSSDMRLFEVHADKVPGIVLDSLAR